MQLTAIECIEQQVSSAVRMFFSGYSHVAYMTLIAINAHAIEKYAKNKSIRPDDQFFYELASENPNFSAEQIKKLLSDFRAVLAHPESSLWDKGVNLDMEEPEVTIFSVCYDLKLLFRSLRRAIPPEIDAFHLWYMAKVLDAVRRHDLGINKYVILRQLSAQSREEQLRRGLKFMNWWTEQKAKEVAET